jgi:histidyl-tRNA synthetase
MKYDLTPPKGTRDIGGKRAKLLEKIIDICKQVFEKYGFEPLFTPAFEKFEILSAKGGLGEAVKDEIYFFEDKANRKLGLRFDLTMPLARFVAKNPQLLKPYKRYAIDRVWRYDNPQRYRYREFWQADIDVIGSESLLADAECLAAACEVLEKLGFKDFLIRVNSRKLVENLLKDIAKEKLKETLRIIDKLDKVGEEGVTNELEKIGVDGNKVLELIRQDFSTIEAKGKEEIEKLLEYAKMFGFEKRIKVDLSLVRGLDYYTSVVYEIFAGINVSCGGGGRYDNLVGIFGNPLPATGISLGISRLFDIIDEGKILKNEKPKVFVTVVDPSLLKECISICQELRSYGIVCEIDLMERTLRKQLDYANSKEFDFVVFLGKKEKEKGVIRVRDMKTGKESEVRGIVGIISEIS